MTDDPSGCFDERALSLALFRYGVIAPLVERETFAPGEVSSLVAELASRTWYAPHVGEKTVSERTVYAWLRAYRRTGLDALRPKVRGDKGSLRAIPDELFERAIQLRKEQPKRTTKTLIDILRREGNDEADALRRSTLDRHLALHGASRRHLAVLKKQRTTKMRFDAFGDLFVGDYHHGPPIRVPRGGVTTAKLGGIIDHCTRYPVAARYYLSEKITTLRDSLLRVLLIWGLFEVFYVDNGKVYKAKQLTFALDRLDARLVHSRAYYSEGRGVIEKFWQVARDFEAEVSAREELLTLHELNVLWEAWLAERYLHDVHSAIGKTPAEAIAEVEPKPLDPEVVRALFRVKETRRVHKKDGCISVGGRRFQCESFLRGQTVEVTFDPNELSSVEVGKHGRRIQTAFPQQVNEEPEPPPEPEQVAQSVDYLRLLREDYDRRLLEHARPLAYADLEVVESFDEAAFIDLVKELAGVTLHASSRGELSRFWRTFQPLPEDLVRIALEHAVRLQGRGRHVRVYVNAIRVLVLAHWRNPTEEDEP